MTNAIEGHTDPKVWDAVWDNPDNLEEWTYLSHIVCESVVDAMSRHYQGDNAAIAEIGCGSGRINIKLGSLLGANIHFLDFSTISVNHLRHKLNEYNVSGQIVQGDMFNIPYKDGSLDMVWNAGVLEHFVGNIQKQALDEMMRVLKPGGLLITLNPYAGSLLHTLGKAFVEKVTVYPYGEEIPIKTLEDQAHALGYNLQEKEFSIGFIALFVGVFKRIMILPGMSLFRYVYKSIDAVFCFGCRFSPIAKLLKKIDLVLSKLFGGYLLVTVIQKP